MNPGFDLLYEQGPCLVVAKPGGLLTQAPPGIDSLETRIKQFLKEREQKSGNVYLAVPHRLDRPVSGAMVFAKHVRAARRLSEQFEARLVRKTYWALVSGVVLEDAGTWTDYVRKLPNEARVECVSPSDPAGQVAVMHFRVLRRGPACSWLEIELETGRTHQVRIQSASRGFPVLGDSLYGSQASFGPEAADPRARWIALHARELQFRHPMTQEDVSQTAPLPPAWEAEIARQFPAVISETRDAPGTEPQSDRESLGTR